MARPEDALITAEQKAGLQRLAGRTSTATVETPPPVSTSTTPRASMTSEATMDEYDLAPLRPERERQVESMPVDQPVASQMPEEQAQLVEGDIDMRTRAFDALGQTESRGNYRAVAPGTNALGKYQMLPSNVIAWSKEAADKGIIDPSIADQLRADPRRILEMEDIQERIAANKFNEYVDRSRAEGYDDETSLRRAYSAWYSGNMNLHSSTDPQGPQGDRPSVKQYVDGTMQRFMNMGGGQSFTSAARGGPQGEQQVVSSGEHAITRGLEKGMSTRFGEDRYAIEKKIKEKRAEIETDAEKYAKEGIPQENVFTRLRRSVAGETDEETAKARERSLSEADDLLSGVPFFGSKPKKATPDEIRKKLAPQLKELEDLEEQYRTLDDEEKKAKNVISGTPAEGGREQFARRPQQQAQPTTGIPAGQTPEVPDIDVSGQQKAIKEGAVAGAAQAAEQAALHKKASDFLEQERRDRMALHNVQQNAIRNAMTELDNAKKEFASTKIDPNRYYRDRSTGQKVLDFIGVVLAGAGQGLMGGNVPNYALQKLERLVERDIDAQRADIAKKKSLIGVQRGMYGLMRQRFADDDMARNASKILTLESIEQQMKERAAHYQAPQTVQAANAAISALQQRSEQLRFEMEMKARQVGAVEAKLRAGQMEKMQRMQRLQQQAKGYDFDTATGARIRMLVPEKLQEKAFDEFGKLKLVNKAVDEAGWLYNNAREDGLSAIVRGTKPYERFKAGLASLVSQMYKISGKQVSEGEIEKVITPFLPKRLETDEANEAKEQLFKNMLKSQVVLPVLTGNGVLKSSILAPDRRR